MIRASLPRFGSSKGISTVIGTIFLVLTVLGIFSSIFLWTITQNSLYNQAVKESRQMDADRLSERVIAHHGNYSISGSNVRVKLTLANKGPVSAQVLTFWVLDENNGEYKVTDLRELKYNLNPGDTQLITIEVAIPGASEDHTFNSWFVTARGNMIPVEEEQVIIVAEVAQGIGSISMEFKTFRWYEVDKDNNLGPAQFNFTITGAVSTVFGITLTNLDETKRDINLTRNSCVWLIVPGTSASASWPIAKVVGGKLATFDSQVLEYMEPTMIFFGKTKPPSSLQGKIAAVNILLYGTIGSDDYGQNIPFIAIYVT